MSAAPSLSRPCPFAVHSIARRDATSFLTMLAFCSVCIPRSICALAKVILNNRLEDVIIVLSSLAQGIYQLSLVSRDLCTGCGTMFAVEECSAANERAFPINQSFFAFVSLIMLPIYFKSISRYTHLHVPLPAHALTCYIGTWCCCPGSS